MSLSATFSAVISATFYADTFEGATVETRFDCTFLLRSTSFDSSVFFFSSNVYHCRISLSATQRTRRSHGRSISVLPYISHRASSADKRNPADGKSGGYLYAWIRFMRSQSDDNSGRIA